MPATDPFLIFVERLHACDIRFMVSGSIAAMYYGEPRLTNDVDIVVFLSASDVTKIVEAFPSDEFYCPPAEVVLVESSRELRGHFNLIHHASGFKADIYPVGRDPLHRWAASRMMETQIDGVSVTFAPPEYVIVRKLQYFREGGAGKHLRDVQRMIAGLGSDWDQTGLDGLIADYGLEEESRMVENFEG